MSSVDNGTISFKVKAPVSLGEQVMVCGDASFLGTWKSEKALPLYTTPVDYPVWTTNEDVPMPPGDCTGYRYCVYRAGKFHRWEQVAKPRNIRLSVTSQTLQDTLDEAPKEVSGKFPVSTTTAAPTPVPSHNERRAQLFSDGVPQFDAALVQHRRPWEGTEEETEDMDRSSDLSSERSSERDSLPTEAGTQAMGLTERESGVTGSTGSDVNIQRAGGMPKVTARATRLETPSFAAARAAATAAACLEASAAPGDGEDVSPGTIFRRSFIQQHQEAVESCIGERSGVKLRRPPSLEAEEGNGGGLGLGLRLGADAMSSPPPRLEASRGSPHVWSPRAGGVVVASYYLPVILSKNSAGEWTACWDREQLLSLQQTNLRVVRVGTVKKGNAEIQEHDKAAVVQALSKLNCVPVFVTEAVAYRCYYQYCKGVLWPVMHNILEMYDNLPDSLLDHKALAEGWQAYKQVNRAFRDKVVEVYHEGDMIWVHGFHLAILPAFLERTVKVARIGLFLHTPFPPSEVFRALPQRDELLRGMLGADQVGFHRFIDGRHFMSSCRKLLGLQHIYNKETGLLQIMHGGKPVILSTGHAGVEPEVVKAALAEPAAQEEVARLQKLHGDRTVLAGVEKVERLKGVWLKMLAFENMLKIYPHFAGRVRMHEVGIKNQARGNDYRACQELVSNLADRINAKHGEDTVVYEEREESEIDLPRRAALMVVSSVFVKTPVHDGLSTTAMEYRIIQQHKTKRASTEKPADESSSIPGVLILSEAVSCSQALRGCLYVNPWKVEAMSEAMAQAITASDREKVAWHEEDVEWCESHTTASWAEGVLGDLSTVPKENRTRYATTGLGLTSRVVGTDPTFKRLSTDEARKAYSASSSRVFFLDYGGTLAKDNTNTSGKAQQDFEQLASLHGDGSVSPPGSSHANRFHDTSKKLRPGSPVLEGLEDLCRDTRNVVFVVSGRGKEELEDAFGHITGLGLAAEHGSFFRWPATQEYGKHGTEREGSDSPKTEQSEWEALHPGVDNAWKAVVRRFMEDFQIHTHGSYVEEKGTSMLWHYGNADPEFGSLQAQKLQDELTDVLCASSSSNTTVEGVIIGGRSSTKKGTGELTGLGGASKGRLFCCEGAARSTSALSGASIDSTPAPGEGGLIEITHEEGQNWDGGGAGAYLEVRARGASKGRFVHMVLGKLGWKPERKGGVASERFGLCVGDDVSDEDMFQALKSYGPVGNMNEASTQNNNGRALGWQQESKETLALETIKGKSPQSLLTVTVGSKPSDADAWLPGVDAVVSLLRTLARVSYRQETNESKGLLASMPPSAIISHTIFHSTSAPYVVDEDGRSTPPFRNTRAFSHGSPPVIAAQPSALGRVLEGTMESGVGGIGVGLGEVLEGMAGIDLGTGVPVVRRHSYTMGGSKPRISLSLNEFLRVVAQPEPEPPMF